ncbi:DsbA family protein [Lederbergia wuyishanensis]|uniref:Protein-disulfide isomerase n=1 Tax=Lederbergia wuyishanensis TaxID=1347903 RepID=A0ABU0D8T5_9BACI|nr:DsbA family protein [Lederbergia wuyishanensis]MCJ8007660.1 DsbA family protein [Lederbergia wuyishanensis]MDQ0344756.1 protein-disulfide isomerase [Lederbergia wuyishanensis]
MNNKKIVLFTVVIFAIIVALVLVFNNKGKNESQEKVSLKNLENQPTMGNEDAPVTIVEFGDYKCPSCKAWGERVFPQLQKDYIDTGKAKLTYINVLFHGNESVLAALASESVFKQDPENFWAFHKGIYDAQPSNQNHDDVWVTTDMLVEIAKAYAPNINFNEFKKDIEEKGMFDQVMIDDKLVKDVNVKYTPTLVINGVMLDDPFDYEAIAAQIEKGLKK